MGLFILFSFTSLTVDRERLHELDILARRCRGQKARADASNGLPHDSAIMAQFRQELVQ